MKKASLVTFAGSFPAEALRILREIPGLAVTEPGGHHRDGEGLVVFAGVKRPVVVEFKARANTATAWHLVNGPQRRKGTALVLIAGETTTDARRILSEHGIAFIDGSGNAHLELPGLLFHVAGTRRPARSPAPTRLAAKAGLVAQALLLEADRPWRLKDLAARTGVSSGLAHRVIARLEAEGVLTASGTGPHRIRRVADPTALLDLWAEENRDKQVRARGYLLAKNPQQLVERLAEALNGAGIDYALTGAAAASIIAPFVTTIAVAEVWVAGAVDPHHLFNQARVTPVAEGHNVSLMQAANDTPLAFREQIGDVWAVNKFRLYADLRRDKRRGVEQADHLRREVIGF